MGDGRRDEEEKWGRRAGSRGNERWREKRSRIDDSGDGRGEVGY